MIVTVEIIVLAMMIAMAIATVSSMKLRRAIIYMGAFSLLASFAYLFSNAPDVAIAEAVIGCTISIILLLTALQKYRIMTIYYVEDKSSEASQSICEEFVADLDKFLHEHEFEPQLIRTTLDDESLHEQDKFDMLVVGVSGNVNVYTASDNFNSDMISKFIKSSEKYHDILFISLIEEADYDG